MRESDDEKERRKGMKERAGGQKGMEVCVNSFSFHQEYFSIARLLNMWEGFTSMKDRV
jgi:hypothetical protein